LHQAGPAPLIPEKPEAVQFEQPDWPNPEPFRRQTPFQVGSPYALIGESGEKPFNQNEWPQPEPFARQQPDQHGKPIALPEPADENPFTQTDWPTPRRSGWQDVLTVGRGLVPDPGDKVPELLHLSQHDWPNPTLRKIRAQFFGTGVPIFDQIEPPFPFKEHPNPYLPFKRQTPFQVGSPYCMIGDKGLKPDLQPNWPNPYLPFKRQTPFQVGSPYALIGEAGIKPFAQNEWPYPEPKPTQEPYQVPVSISLEETEEVPGAGGGSWDPHTIKKVKESLAGIKRRAKPFEKQIDEEIQELVDEVIEVIEQAEIGASPFAIPEPPKHLSRQTVTDIAKSITKDVVIPGQEVAQLVRKQAVARDTLLSNIRREEKLSKRKAVLQLENRINDLVSKRRRFFIREQEDIDAIMVILGGLDD
jgi:hypothetical protein